MTFITKASRHFSDEPFDFSLYLIPLISASLMFTPLIINYLQMSKTLIGNGLETSCLRRSALFQYVKYLMQR